MTEKKAPHKILTEDLLKAKEGKFVGSFWIPQWVLQGLGVQFLANTKLKSEHRAGAIKALKEVQQEKSANGYAKDEIDKVIEALEKESEETKEKTETKEV